MSNQAHEKQLFSAHIIEGDHSKSDYFALVRELVQLKNSHPDQDWQQSIDKVYSLIEDEIINNENDPPEEIKFGTSGWRGILGKDITLRTVACVTRAIVEMYSKAEKNPELCKALGVNSLAEAKKRGCVIGHDNRFGGEILAKTVAWVLSNEGFTVYYAGESTTGVLSAAVLELQCSFSVNLTPSHNPMQYGGYKFNAADAGPAEAQVTETITKLAREFVKQGFGIDQSLLVEKELVQMSGLKSYDSLSAWKSLVVNNEQTHGLSLPRIIEEFSTRNDMVITIDAVHGASRLHIPLLFNEEKAKERLISLRCTEDVTFGGIAPEPSSANMKSVVETLNKREEKLKLGAIIDPDGDRIRFTDGKEEISMNQFGAMAYHFLKSYKKKNGMVAKTVATSNMANRLAESFGEELYEPRVGFKEFKPVIGRALVIFEESDGISIIGHTPEKDAYIGLLLAMDMVLTTGMNLGEYKASIEAEFGAYYPDRDGIEVSIKGEELLKKLTALEKYAEGVAVEIGSEKKTITQVITIDGRKMVFDDGSWLMIRPSGTEPKVRFYVESRTKSGTNAMVDAARRLLKEIGVV